MKTPYYSYKVGKLAKGCELCVQGKKLVLFITGLCPRCCDFCPISDAKYKKDVIFADEWQISDLKDILKEARSIDAKGAGITGGDPLCRLDRTISVIRMLRSKYGKKFHIHLYTSLNLVTKPTLDRLYQAGLDEIRFHLDFNKTTLWKKIELAFPYNWDVGIEIPAIPGNEKVIKQIIKNIHDYNQNRQNIKFLNLNELEVADNKVSKLLEKGFKTKEKYSYAVKGSEELALKLLNFIEKNKLRVNVHYCTATLKDKVQLANRIKRRAKNIKKPYDTVTEDGTLIRGAIYLERPSFGYRKMLEKLTVKQRRDYLLRLGKIRDRIIKIYNVQPESIEIDKEKLRVLTKPSILKRIKEPIRAIVEEYPTQDQTELSIEFL
ncbi:MAG: radical SAM protein [Nanoarchaeota archaeon]|nr:radical SAM protein [Nanoarchaeota archaeon]MBU1703870.1 radical SAM protein [Nanoarchaeota archaeon]